MERNTFKVQMTALTTALDGTDVQVLIYRLAASKTSDRRSKSPWDESLNQNPAISYHTQSHFNQNTMLNTYVIDCGAMSLPVVQISLTKE